MNWTFREVKSGDIIRIQLGPIYHYGIYVSDEEIIQFDRFPPEPDPGLHDRPDGRLRHSCPAGQGQLRYDQVPAG